MSKTYTIKTGFPYPAGATANAEGVNFSIFSRHANFVELLLFDSAVNPEPFQVIPLKIEVNRTFYAWHVFVENLSPGVWYAWRMDGPKNTKETGFKFDRDKHLIDPWARAVSQKLWDRGAACRPGDNGRCSMRCMVVEDNYDWEGDLPLSIRSENAIIYELHVGGFTRHASADVKHPGTFAGLIEKIPYLRALGITHVELLPVMAFDTQDVPAGTAELGLENYWGYSTHSFFSPHAGYCVTPEQGTHQFEFRDMVKALHRAGIGVILDVVFNHTAEGGAEGPIINFKGVDNDIFYHLDPIDKSVYRDYTGCGNTVNANHPKVSNFIINCLEYWVEEMHVDGFRFDLASALARGDGGMPLHDPPVLWGIELSEKLSRTKLIAEAWDAAGLYQVGSFPGYRWGEWNGQYRDLIRRFLRGDKGLVGELATRISGSSDLYHPEGRLPINSINFVTCHDGFTLFDLFSYNEKHNLANGENNRDGCTHNYSWNCGVEGPSDDAGIIALRLRQVKNAFVLVLLSQGVPMLLAGDEVLKTQYGNNNGYCQNNELTWFDWNISGRKKEMLQFVRRMIALRKRSPCLMRRRFLKGDKAPEREMPDVSWHGMRINDPLWSDPDARVLAFTLAGIGEGDNDLHIMLNMSDHKIDMELPVLKSRHWCLAIDTSANFPDDAILPENQSPYNNYSYPVEARTIVVMESSLDPGLFLPTASKL
ncbi:MAG: glycogen debranching protein GlgX [Gammaproteobacteria bacterium]